MKKRLSAYEFDIMSKSKSRNLLKCYDLYEDRNKKIIVEEYCNMGTLKQ
jgi:hypothetical protein